MIQLNEQEMHEQTAKKLRPQLDAMQPGLRAEDRGGEAKAALTAAQREALDTPVAKRTGKQFELAAQAEEAIKVTHNEVARQDHGPEARRGPEARQRGRRSRASSPRTSAATARS